jgi:hypothetical protein
MKPLKAPVALVAALALTGFADPAQAGPVERDWQEGYDCRQPVRTGRPVDVKPQPLARARQGEAGQAASRGLVAKAADAVKAANPSPKAP